MKDSAEDQVVTVEQVGTWWRNPPKELWGEAPPFIAKIPALQRGIVWKPHQVELLWDSLLRGFPIGSFVVCHPIPGQSRDGDGAQGENVRHLLDGLQRVHAIQAAFIDPWGSEQERKDAKEVVWLDLNPGDHLKGTTRRFLVRVTNKAHPWGFQVDDQQTRPLTSREIRAACEAFGCGDGRPDLLQAWPYKSSLPLPLSWLLRAASRNRDKPDKIDQMWQEVVERCREVAPDSPEGSPFRKAPDFIETMKSGRRADYFNALIRALNHKIVALQVPEDVLRSTVDEQAEPRHDSEGEGLSPIEQLFGRLNRGGTVPSIEELVYSIMKIWSPYFQYAMEKFSDATEGKDDEKDGRALKPVPDARLANLAARAVLTVFAPGTEAPQRLERSLSVQRLRSLARSADNSEKGQQREALIDFFKNDKPASLVDCCRVVDRLLLYRGQDDFGLPPFLRSEIAWHSQEVYLLLLTLVLKSLQETGSISRSEEIMEAIRKPLIALATTVHWFGLDKERCCDLALQALWPRLGDPTVFRGIVGRWIAESQEKLLVAKLQAPDALVSLEGWKLPDPNAGGEDEFAKWTWWSNLIGDDADKRLRLWPFLDRLRRTDREVGAKGLLAFAQRGYMGRRFKDYDPADLAFWEGHSRPWDYDHILALASVYNLKKDTKFVNVVREWINTIGNLRICPLEENRSYQDDPANKKIEDSEDARRDALLESKEEVDAFSAKRGEVAKDATKAHKFCTAAQARLVRIYQKWWETLDIRFLMDGSGGTEPKVNDLSNGWQGGTGSAAPDAI